MGYTLNGKYNLQILCQLDHDIQFLQTILLVFCRVQCISIPQTKFLLINLKLEGEFLMTKDLIHINKEKHKLQVMALESNHLTSQNFH